MNNVSVREVSDKIRHRFTSAAARVYLPTAFGCLQFYLSSVSSQFTLLTGTDQDLKPDPKFFPYGSKGRITEPQAQGKFLILGPGRTPEMWLHNHTRENFPGAIISHLLERLLLAAATSLTLLLRSRAVRFRRRSSRLR
ncbi:hypothetical protein E2C01_007044 [Portunus trituberculatus]|uniref:Uncharacterized protein n=1 Tax=Portunus trituberculatus TaxID=210409 RepID=A0A5B7CZE6_PORTR|nr:hypothetical protein [Portunus trituberculatus]